MPILNPELVRSTMQENAVLMHGKTPEKRFNDPTIPKPWNAGTIGWLTVELTLRGYDVTVPHIAAPFLAKYVDWERPMDNGLRVGPQTTLIGHSLGAAAEFKWITERPAVRVKQMIAYGTWADPNGRYPESHMDFKIDPNLPDRCERGIDIFVDPADDAEVQLTHKWLQDSLPPSEKVRYHQLSGRGHFLMGNMLVAPEFDEVIAAMTSPPAVVQ